MSSNKSRATKKTRQFRFSGEEFKPINEFGGSLHGESPNTHPKSARPVSTKDALHIVLRSEIANGMYSLMRFRKIILSILGDQSTRFHIKIYECAIVGNHIHLLIYLKTNHTPTGRAQLSNFLRSITGLIARKVLSAEKASAVLNPLWRQKFWSHRPYTRIVKGYKRSYQIMKDYIIQNHLEAIGVISYKIRKHFKSKNKNSNKTTSRKTRGSPIRKY